ncbi:Replicase polyprotein 1a [Frankliniella fusca]|uniref:Replicase polyprotein 1a n=1 Tax=Frankliniella fusca TaxID=407009 RepID=A0AAE1HL43_9NEOP|nr:Replicase polyprotein 1a [Frankliniella fusca]
MCDTNTLRFLVHVPRYIAPIRDWWGRRVKLSCRRRPVATVNFTPDSEVVSAAVLLRSFATIMDILNSFNSVNDAELNPVYCKQGELEQNVEYVIESVERSTTSVGEGRKVVLRLAAKRLFTYLPQRYIAAMTDPVMAAINAGGYTLRYEGMVAGFGHKFALSQV